MTKPSKKASSRLNTGVLRAARPNHAGKSGSRVLEALWRVLLYNSK